MELITKQVIHASNIPSFLKELSNCSKDQIMDYIGEVVALEGTDHHPILLLEAVVCNKVFEFLWLRYRDIIKPLLLKVQKELQQGYYVGSSSDPMPFPVEFFKTLNVSFLKYSKNQKSVESFFRSELYKKFITECTKKISDNFDDEQ